MFLCAYKLNGKKYWNDRIGYLNGKFLPKKLSKPTTSFSPFNDNNKKRTTIKYISNSPKIYLTSFFTECTAD